MADIEAKRESGISLMFLGLIVWVGDLLVLFYLPAGVKIGRHQGFFAILMILFLLGTYLMIAGFRQHRRAGNED